MNDDVMKDKIHTLRNISLLADCDETTLQELRPHTEWLALGAGETLFEQGEVPDYCYTLTDGQIHITREYPDGSEGVLATEGPFYVIGEISLLARQPRTGTVTAVSDCEMLRISRDTIFGFFQAHPEAVENGITRLSERLYRQTLHIREGGIGHGYARLASALLLLCGDGQEVANFPLPLPVLARTTALEALVVRWELQEWAARSILDYDGKRISIKDIAALRELANS